jgi:hypothetical protein
MVRGRMWPEFKHRTRGRLRSARMFESVFWCGLNRGMLLFLFS